MDIIASYIVVFLAGYGLRSYISRRQDMKYFFVTPRPEDRHDVGALLGALLRDYSARVPARRHVLDARSPAPQNGVGLGRDAEDSAKRAAGLASPGSRFKNIDPGADLRTGGMRRLREG
jgi:hypothetical protein